MQPPDWVQRFYAAVDSGGDALAPLRGGGKLTLPSCTVLRRGADGIASMRVYLDEGLLRA